MCTLSNSITVPFLDKTTIDISHARKILKKYDESLLTEMKQVDIEDIVSKENNSCEKGENFSGQQCARHDSL